MSSPTPEALRSLIVLCLGGAPGAATAIEDLAVQRRALAEGLLATASDAQALAPCRAAVEDLALSGLPYDAGEDRSDLGGRISRALASGAPPMNAVMAAMALAPAHHFPVLDLTAVPPDLCLLYARYLMAGPAIFEDYGEAVRFAHHRLRAMEQLHTAVFQQRLPDAEAIADIAAGATNHMLYFNGVNLAPYFRLRAELLEWRLAGLNHPLHHLPPLTARPRVRIGLLHSGLDPMTETYYLLAHLVGRQPSLEIILYLDHPPSGPLTPEFARRVDRIAVVPAALAAAAAHIRGDDLDVLLISRNITAGNSPAVRLAAHRLARVQIVGAASPVTSGLSSADFFLSGEANEPAADAQDHYQEALARLPGLVTTYAYAYDRDPRTRSFARADFGIAAADVVFFSAANCFKILPEVFQTWARILAATPGSRLMLMPYNPNWFDSYATTLFQRRIARQLADHGVAAERVVVLSAVPARTDLHAAMAMADIYLDSFPFSGACSLVDPLQVGLPIVAMDGTAFRTAVAASILRATGFDHMVCPDVESYVTRACALAGDATLRQRERDDVRQIDPAFLPCTWTAPLAQDFSDFARDAAAAWFAKVDALRALAPADLQEKLRELAQDLRQQRNPGYLQLTDLALITQCLYPYLQTLRAEGAPAGRIVDVGACVGEASMPFLRGGWRVDLFEPDPECLAPLTKLCAAFSNATHYAAAVTAAPEGLVTFHKRSMGLSGLGASPYARGEREVVVASTTLNAVYGAEKPAADVLKIDAEGFDLEILAGVDIKRLAPKAVMIEFGTAFARQTPAAIRETIARMATEGYSVVAFSNRQLEGFGRSNWSCELDALTFGGIPPGDDIAGNLVFFRAGDTTFLTCLLMLLDSFQPARKRRWGLTAA